MIASTLPDLSEVLVTVVSCCVRQAEVVADRKGISPQIPPELTTSDDVLVRVQPQNVVGYEATEYNSPETRERLLFEFFQVVAIAHI